MFNHLIITTQLTFFLQHNFIGRKSMMEEAMNTESMMATLGLGGGMQVEVCLWSLQGGAGGSAYCTSSSSKFSSAAAYFRGRPRCMCRPHLNSSSSTVQKDPNSSSTLTKHLCRERLVRTAPWESKPAGTARCRCSDGRDRGRTHRTDTGRKGEGEDQHENKHKPLCVMGHHRGASESMKGRHTEASGDSGLYGTQTMKWSNSSLFPSVNVDTDASRY